jgi:hypothetical protein
MKGKGLAHSGRPKNGLSKYQPFCRQSSGFKYQGHYVNTLLSWTIVGGI